jgi:hypothetical protein
MANESYPQRRTKLKNEPTHNNDDDDEKGIRCSRVRFVYVHACKI